MGSETKNSPLKALLGVSLIMALFASVMFFRAPGGKPPPELQAVLWPQPRQLQDFNLTDHLKRPFGLDRLGGKWTLLFFGYTHCPDVCPMALSVMRELYAGLDQYPEIKADTQIVFVSVDPERDPPERLAEYVTYFDKDFIGVTGAAGEIDNFARQMSAGYVKEPVGESGNYQMNHTGSIYLIGPQKRVHGAFAPPHEPRTMVSQYLKILEFRQKG
ncbi:MAG TPA: SCO family protein [Sedimenticola sp.]|nr:SCO family protein [Sedimenticola sp.]